MTMTMSIRSIARATMLVALTAGSTQIHAQNYPNRPIRLVIAQTVGGNADFVARQFGERLAQRFGQQVVADNRPGGGGIIGPETVARAAADGYTLLLAPTSFGINPALHPKLPYDPMRDFAPISLLASSSAVVVVSPQIAAKTIGELVALAKSQPGKLHFGSSGMASSNHLAGELFKHMAGIDTVHVPYKGAPPALVDLVSGRIQFMFASPPSVMSLVRSGKLKAIATTGTKRAAQLPDLPTVAESGVPGYQSTIWQSLLAPAKTPGTIVKRLHAEVADIARQPEMKEKLIVDGSEAIGGTPQELADHIAGEIARWTKVIKAIGLKPN